MTLRICLMAGVAGLLLTSAAQAAGGIYLGGGVGYQSPMSGSFQAPALGEAGKYSLKGSGTVMLDAGYKFSSGIRLELEGQYGQFDGDQVKITTPAIASSPLDGHITQGTLYLNANYDFPMFLGWTATVGGGVGTNWTDTSGSAFSGLTVLHGSDHAFAWQVGGGIVHRILPMLDLQLDYRYQGTGSISVHSGAGDVDLGKVDSQTVTLGVRWYLNPL